MSENLGIVRKWEVCYGFINGTYKVSRFDTREEAELFAATLPGSIIEEYVREKKKHYLIVNNADPNLFWNYGVGNGEWAKKGSYYSTEEGAQEDIDAEHLDAHIEYDIW